MKSSAEMRREARQLLKDGWFFRVITVAAVLQAACNLVVGTLARVHGEMGIVRMGDYLDAKVKALRQGLDYTLPTAADHWRMLAAGLMENFFLYVFGAIMLYGVTCVLLKSLRRDETRWFADSMGGFRRPLGMAGLLFLQNLKVLLWSLLFLVPGLIAAYRYRQAWYVKSEHPDWSARACLAESARMMNGYKARAFLLDLSYFGWLALMLLSAGCANVTGNALAWFAALTLLVTLAVYYTAGRTVFYREVKALNPPCPAES